MARRSFTAGPNRNAVAFARTAREDARHADKAVARTLVQTLLASAKAGNPIERLDRQAADDQARLEDRLAKQNEETRRLLGED